MRSINSVPLPERAADRLHECALPLLAPGMGVTRQPAAGLEKGAIATLGGARLAVCRHVRQVSRTAPTLGVRSPRMAVTLNPASSRPGLGPMAATDEDVLLRLALWLADVAAETSVGKSAP